MISEERKFLKLLDLYTQVVESGSTWGVQSDEDVAMMIQATKRRFVVHDPEAKYTVRQTACLPETMKRTNYLNRVVGSSCFMYDTLDVQDSYPNVRTGTPIRKPNRRRVYW